MFNKYNVDFIVNTFFSRLLPITTVSMTLLYKKSVCMVWEVD